MKTTIMKILRKKVLDSSFMKATERSLKKWTKDNTLDKEITNLKNLNQMDPTP